MMNLFYILSTLIFLTIFPVNKEYPTIGHIQVIDPKMEEIVDPSSAIEIIGQGMKWAEGPVWVEKKRFLLFSDPSQNIIYKWDEKDKLQEFMNPSGYAGADFYSDEPGTNGLLINHEGDLVACDHGNRRISLISLQTKQSTPLIDQWEGKKFNSPNDICQHPNGDYYFTDPPYGLPDRTKDTVNKEISQNGVYRLSSNGKLTQVIKDLDRPNGIALSSDAKKLYVALSDGAKPFIMVYDLSNRNGVENARVFFDFGKHFPNESMAADGIKIDQQGNMYAAAGDGVVVIDSDGKLLGRIKSGIRTANCALAGDGFLYMTATDKLLRVKLKNK